MHEQSPLHDLYVDHLKDLYDAEKQLIRTLPGLAALSTHDDLDRALEDHLEETRNHVSRLERILGHLNREPVGAHCAGMAGLLEEAVRDVRRRNDPAARDAALIATAQRIEHYEIAGYGTVRAFAQQLGYENAGEVLGETLEEEEDCDRRLSELATGGHLRQGINLEALRQQPSPSP
jgi:ferritin-like metal-binding protein YciE